MNYWQRLRNEIVERDGRRCRDCGRERITFAHFIALPRQVRHHVWSLRLEVHHLSGPTGRERYLPGPHNHPDNLVTLCAPCHMARHGKRHHVSARYPQVAVVGLPAAGGQSA